jgi:phage tail-like protein
VLLADAPVHPPTDASARNGQLARSLAASSYLQYLPAPYQGDAFLGRFLLIFETILGPIEHTIDTLAAYFDPRLAPPELLPWLAGWVDLQLDENWPLERQRQLILWAATLYRWRGTRRGLREHLRLYAGRPPLIVENFDGARLGADARMGANTRIGSPLPRPHTIHVTVIADDPSQLDERILRQIIELEKPAHVAYTLDVQTAGGQHA